MNEKLLCRCSNSIIAHRVIDVLRRNSIDFRELKETNEFHSGIHGPTPTIVFFVLEEHYDKAVTLIAPIFDSPVERIKPCCPNCGSDDTRCVKPSRFVTPLLLLSIFLFIAPIVYLYYSTDSDNQLMFYLSIIIFISSILIITVCCNKHSAYKCNQCGKKFNRK